MLDKDARKRCTACLELLRQLGLLSYAAKGLSNGPVFQCAPGHSCCLPKAAAWLKRPFCSLCACCRQATAQYRSHVRAALPSLPSARSSVAVPASSALTPQLRPQGQL